MIFKIGFEVMNKIISMTEQDISLPFKQSLMRVEIIELDARTKKIKDTVIQVKEVANKLIAYCPRLNTFTFSIKLSKTPYKIDRSLTSTE